MECFDVMVDVETTGTHPDRTAMIQLAAVKFNFETGAVDRNFFNRCLQKPPMRYWDEETRQWWSKQKPSILKEITIKGENPLMVMEDFAEWCGYSNAEPLRFWAKPISFDWPFVASYFTEYRVHNPFNFRYAIDVNSFLRGRKNQTALVELDLPFEGDKHNAIFDVLHQIKLVFAGKDL